MVHDRTGGDGSLPDQFGAFDARTHFGQLLTRVESGETLTITRNSRPVARLIPAVEQAPRSLSTEELGKQFAAFRQGHPAGDVSSQELIAEGRRH